MPFNAEADSLNCAILAPDVTPDDEEFDLFVKEVAREMTTKAGQKCTAIRRAIVPRQAHRCGGRPACVSAWPRVVVGDPSVEGVRMGALASHEQQKDVAERAGNACCRAATCCSAPATVSRRGAKASPKARSSRRPCC